MLARDIRAVISEDIPSRRSSRIVVTRVIGAPGLTGPYVDWDPLLIMVRPLPGPSFAELKYPGTPVAGIGLG
jgi:hypothetical protein